MDRQMNLKLSFLGHFSLASAVGLTASLLLGMPSAGAAVISLTAINAQSDIYQAGGADGSGGVAPTILDVTGLASVSFSIPSSITVALNSGGNYNDADGVGSADSDSYNSGANHIAGLTAPNDGFLAGVFLGSTISSTTPSALTFTSTNFTSLAPELQQAFFIGDGLTGDGTGAVQTFYVPTGATRLVLGISDACGYHGSPGCYSDNSGTFTALTVSGVTSSVSAVPLPGAAPMFGAAFVALGVVGYGLRRKKEAVTTA
ncbi:hypothetical protein [Lichenifustis flavocetrariae]|uniref:Uncharacterized protein n=1 Tax=Lichenifustis flavocetrariae TaxID=2949735 RepID=A0AA42CIW1_9HYPH|nr:hypothetical protein [Lichenifustis flavocetrariae]MCW6508809.1 hypothetical protein [Lichenifustis flavocetrariae]